MRVLQHVQKHENQKVTENPAPGVIVALYHSEFDKWIRAIYENDSVYWCMDYGFPYQPKRVNIVTLPMDLAKVDINRIFLGGLAACLPAERTYNINKNKVEYKPRLNWTSTSIEMLQNLNKRAFKIEFHVEFKNLLPNHNFGHLTYYTANPEPICAFDFLADFSEAVVRNDFAEYLYEMETLTKLRWKDNDNNPMTWQSEIVVISEKTSALADDLNDLQISDQESRQAEEDILSDCNTAIYNDFFDKSASTIMGPEDLEMPKKIVIEPKLSSSRAVDAAYIPYNSLNGNGNKQANSKKNKIRGFLDQYKIPTAKQLQEIMPKCLESNKKNKENDWVDIKPNPSIDSKESFLATGYKRSDPVEILPRLPNTSVSDLYQSTDDDVSEISVSPSMPGLTVIKVKTPSTSSKRTCVDTTSINSVLPPTFAGYEVGRLPDRQMLLRLEKAYKGEENIVTSMQERNTFQRRIKLPSTAINQK